VQRRLTAIDIAISITYIKLSPTQVLFYCLVGEKRWHDFWFRLYYHKSFAKVQLPIGRIKNDQTYNICYRAVGGFTFGRTGQESVKLGIRWTGVGLLGRPL
jgi:hypothetical protein